MRTVRLAACIVLWAVAAACVSDGDHDLSPTGVGGVDDASMPASAATTPQMRTDGGYARRHQRIVAETAVGGHEIVFLGASIVEGWTSAGKERWEAVWLPRGSVNCGIGGDRTQHVLARLDGGLLDAMAAPGNRVRWVVMNIGSNNLASDSPREIAAGVRAIVLRLQRRIPGVEVALLAVTPRGRFPGPLREKAIATNTLLAEFVHEHGGRASRVHLMDLGPRFVTATGEIPADLMPDFLHPSAAGYRVWSDELEKIVR